jgi:hypothetical protein
MNCWFASGAESERFFGAARARPGYRAATEVRSIGRQTFFTHRSVSTFDRVPFQLTDALFLHTLTYDEFFHFNKRF